MGFRGQLNTQDFEALIRRVGEVPAGYLRRIGPCPQPHRGVVSGFTPNAVCPLCGGVGELFEAAAVSDIAARSPAEGRLILVNATLAKQKQPIEIEVGDIQATYLPGDYEMAEGDRLLLKSRDDWAAQNVVRDSGRKGADTDALRYWPVLEIGAVVAQSGRVDPLSYAVSGDGKGITFYAGVLPGQQYTVRYRYRPQWAVVPQSHVKRIEATNGDRFPNRCILRKWAGLALDAQGGNV